MARAGCVFGFGMKRPDVPQCPEQTSTVSLALGDGAVDQDVVDGHKGSCNTKAVSNSFAT